jgi:hypothetical protein
VKRIDAVKVTCLLERASAPFARQVLMEAKAHCLTIQSGRNVSMKSSRGLFGLRSSTVLDERPSDIIRALVPVESETAVMETIVEKAGLSEAGRGSIYSESAHICSGAGMDLALEGGGQGGWGLSPGAEGKERKRSGSSPLSDSLEGILSVVQRDQGNTLARSILEMGFSVPALSFGQGMGLRSKLGLLRVTIPAGKETLLFLVDRAEAGEALVLASETIGLEVPGKGFIYQFPIRKGLADTRIHQDTDRYHVASTEQIIAAIDQISGGSQWRRRAAYSQAGQSPEKTRQARHGKAAQRETELVNLTLSCADGLATAFLEEAMNLGAKGATLSQIQGLSFKQDPNGARTARESSDLILPSDKAEKILESIERMGFFDPTVGGLAEITKVTRSVAYSPINK